MRNHMRQDHANAPESVQKAAVRSWFECKYSREPLAGAGSMLYKLNRTTLLGEINVFVLAMGWPKWSSQTLPYSVCLRSSGCNNMGEIWKL